MKKKKSILIAVLLILVVLAVAFFLGDPAADSAVSSTSIDSVAQEQISEPEHPEENMSPPQSHVQPEGNTSPQTPPEKELTAELPAETEEKPSQTEPAPAEKPVPEKPQDTLTPDTAHSCTISISCATILNNMDQLEPGKEDLIPANGWLLSPVTVSFEEGESVFDVLLKAAKKHKIHMEYMDSPIYDSAYIEGIANLYEFDCGPLSGWMYNVNGNFPNFGCSKYALKDGDVIEWVYTCDLGADVGDNSMSSQMMPQ